MRRRVVPYLTVLSLPGLILAGLFILSAVNAAGTTVNPFAPKDGEELAAVDRPTTSIATSSSPFALPSSVSEGMVSRSPDGASTYRLRPKMDLSWFAIPVVTEGKEVSFRKEPDFGRHKVHRGFLPTSSTLMGPTGYAVDFDDATLHVDLNRNLDLTDDPEGFFQGEGTEGSVYFNDVHLSLRLGDSRRDYVLAFFFSRYSGRVHGSGIITSGWRGDIALGGRTYGVEVMDNLDGHIDSRDRLTLYPIPIDPSERFQFSAAPRLFWSGVDHRIAFDFAVTTATKTVDLLMTVKADQVPMGELALEGRNVESLLLQGPERVALLESPASSARLPVGAYRNLTCRVRSADNEIVFSADALDPISIAEDTTATLRMGAPLRHSLQASRRGRTLTLSYDLKGVGGESYQDVNPASGYHPRYEVYKGEKRVAAGSFDYG